MFSIINKSPILKDKNSGYRIAIIVLSLICGAFILSPVLTFLLQGQAPLAEMPVGSFYYIIRGLFGITLLIACAILFITGNVTIVAIPSLFGLIASLIPLIDRTQKFIDHKKRSTRQINAVRLLVAPEIEASSRELCTRLEIFGGRCFRRTLPHYKADAIVRRHPLAGHKLEMKLKLLRRAKRVRGGTLGHNNANP